MAFQQENYNVGQLEAAADLSSHQHKAVKVVSGGINVCSAAGEEALGLLQNAPGSGEAAEVAVVGTAKGLAGAAISKGEKVACDANGKLKTAVESSVDTSDTGVASDPVVGSHVLGYALEAASADGDIISVALVHMGATPTTDA